LKGLHECFFTNFAAQEFFVLVIAEISLKDKMVYPLVDGIARGMSRQLNGTCERAFLLIGESGGGTCQSSSFSFTFSFILTKQPHLNHSSGIEKGLRQNSTLNYRPCLLAAV